MRFRDPKTDYICNSIENDATNSSIRSRLVITFTVDREKGEGKKRVEEERKRNLDQFLFDVR